MVTKTEDSLLGIMDRSSNQAASSYQAPPPPPQPRPNEFYIGSGSSSHHSSHTTSPTGVTFPDDDDDDDDGAGDDGEEYPETDPRSSRTRRTRNKTGMGSWRYLQNTLLLIVVGIMACLPHSDARDVVLASTVAACAYMDTNITTLTLPISCGTHHIFMQTPIKGMRRAKEAISTMHMVSGREVPGLIVDPGASSAIMGTEVFRSILHDILIPLGLQVKYKKTNARFTGIDGQPEPGISRVEFPLGLASLPNVTLEVDLIGNAGSTCPGYPLLDVF